MSYGWLRGQGKGGHGWAGGHGGGVSFDYGWPAGGGGFDFDGTIFEVRLSHNLTNNSGGIGGG